MKQTWGVSYSKSGITQLLKRMGSVYKKPKLIAGKANAEKQREFIERYHELKATKAPEDPIHFMDAVPPLEFLPPYAPNLNLIERYWKLFKKKVLYGR